MSDYGIKISQQGNDVNGADRRLLFSSSWPILGIKEEGSISVASPGDIITTHGLGYVPMFWAYTNERFQAGATSGIASFNHRFVSRIVVNDTNLESFSGGSGTFTGRYFIFAIDIEKPFTAESINTDTPADEVTPNRDWGIRVSKPGKSISSTDLRDYTIHSGTRTPMIHSVTPGSKEATPTTVTVDHNLGYPPMFFVYARFATATQGYQIVGNATDSRVSVSDTDLSLYIPYVADYSIVILKDPLVGV